MARVLRPGSTRPRSRSFRILFGAALGSGFGCGAEAPDPPALLEAQPSRLEASAAFDLELLGRGFGLVGVRVDLDRGRGTRGSAAPAVTLVGPEAYETTLRPPDLLVVAPSRLRLRVRLETPPPIGTYGARWEEDGEIRVEATGLFELVEPETGD